MTLRIPVCLANLLLWSSACAQPPAQDDKYVTSYMSVAPPTMGTQWQRLSHSETNVTYGRGDKDNSYIATVALFRMASATSPAEYEDLVRDLVARDIDPEQPDRYDILEQTIAYSTERPYPCVRYHGIAWDKAARGASGPLIMEMEGLYCRHPKDETLGAAILYSHRGTERASSLGDEANAFIGNSKLDGSQ